MLEVNVYVVLVNFKFIKKKTQREHKNYLELVITNEHTFEYVCNNTKKSLFPYFSEWSLNFSCNNFIFLTQKGVFSIVKVVAIWYEFEIGVVDIWKDV